METIKLLSQAIEKGGVLATIVRVEGSAYRKKGAMMLVTQDGEQIGMISASCLEADVQSRGMQLIHNQQAYSELIVYDMSLEDDLAWGRGAGCNGKVHVLLEKIDSTLRTSLQNMLHLLKHRQVVTIYKDLQYVPNKVLTTYESYSSESMYKEIMNNNSSNVYCHTIIPPQRLVVFGAGPDAMPLLQIAKQAGFDLYIWDWRPAQLKQAKHYGICMIDWQQLDFHANDYVVVMTHDFQYDTGIIRYLLTLQPLRYVGVLGPRKRLERLLGKQEIPSYIHNPIGLSIGAEGAIEIAISIVAELVKIKRKEVNIDQKSDRYLFSGREKY